MKEGEGARIIRNHREAPDINSGVVRPTEFLLRKPGTRLIRKDVSMVSKRNSGSAKD